MIKNLNPIMKLFISSIIISISIFISNYLIIDPISISSRKKNIFGKFGFLF